MAQQKAVRKTGVLRCFFTRLIRKVCAMADQESKDTDQKVQEKKGSKKKLLILVGLSLVILVAGGGLAWKTGLAAKYLGERFQNGQSKAKAQEKEKSEIGPIYSLGTFIVNLDDPVRRSYLKMKAELELADEKVSEQVDERLPVLRDGIILLLSSKSFDDIASMEGKGRLRRELLRELGRHLDKGSLRAIYFTEFVVQ
jgi:flagellar FliL protein